MDYYKQQIEKLRIAQNEENFIKIQLSSVGGKTNYMTITEKQLNAILQILESETI